MKLNYDKADTSRVPAFYLKGKRILILDQKFKDTKMYEQVGMVIQIKSKFYIGAPDIKIDNIEISEYDLISYQLVNKEKFPELYL